MEKHSKRQEHIATMEIQPSQDVELVAQNNEQFGSPDGRDIENRLPSPRDDENYRNAYRSLYHAAMKDNWRVAEAILKKYPRIVVDKLGEKGNTVLHVATIARSIRFVGELMKVMKVSELELKNNDRCTAFFYAAGAGYIEIAKAMVERNKNLPNICDKDNYPITLAARAGLKAMVSYLFEVTSLDEMGQDARLDLLYVTIHNEMYEAALNIFNNDRKLTHPILYGNADVLYLLSQKSLTISNQEVKSNTKFTSAISMGRSQFITLLKLLRLLPKRYVPKQQAAGLLLEKLWAESVRSAEKKLLEVVENKSFLHSAAKAGNAEFIATVIRSHPDLIWQLDDQRRTIFHVAVLYRQDKVFSLIHQIEGLKSLLLLQCDKDGNSILHLAAKLGYYSNVNDEEKSMPPSFLRVSGAALQMQREILWFKEVEKLLPPAYHSHRNKYKKTARELFTEEHKQLLKEGEKWMKDTANSCMLVATLIATVVFAAAFTVPGGTNDADGIPIFLKLNAFTSFVISDAVALYCSIISILMFLSILTSRYAEDDFRVSLPNKLLFGLVALFFSIYSMHGAFTETFYLFYGIDIMGNWELKKIIALLLYGNWKPRFIAACASVPIALFGHLHYKLYFDLAKTTYFSKSLFRSAKCKLY